SAPKNEQSVGTKPSLGMRSSLDLGDVIHQYRRGLMDDRVKSKRSSRWRVRRHVSMRSLMRL
ncbi:hypothetical protein NZA98_21425, partial [Escherichia coli]|nr:hypothetical protein [Escherichia coli]